MNNGFFRNGVWHPLQWGRCTSCGHLHTGAVVSGDRCSRCAGVIGATVVVGGGTRVTG